MAETDLRIEGDSGNKVQIDPTKIRGEGGPDYPRIIMPIDLLLKPISGYKGQSKPYVILDIKGKLYLANYSNKLSDALALASSVTVFNSYTVQHQMEFPIDAYRVKKIEEIRKGDDLKLRLDLYFTIGVYTPLIVQNKPKEETKHFMTEIVSSFAQVNSIDIPQSSWIKILPSLGYMEYFLVEVPKSSVVIKDAWQYLEKAESAFTRWDMKGICANCREIGVTLDKNVKGAFGEDSYAYKLRWLRAYGKYEDYCSLGLHIEDVKKSDKYNSADVKIVRADAEYLIFVTKALIKYAEDLLLETKVH